MDGFITTYVWPGAIILAQSLLVLVALLLFIAYILYADRKIWAAVQLRRGPNVVGPWGLFQSFADLLKFVFKEPVIPSGANKAVFLLAPLVAVTLALAAWAVIPFDAGWVIADINVGILFVFAISSLEVYGDHHGRLGIELEISVPGRASIGGADGVLRGLHRLRHRHRAALRRFAQPHRYRAGAGRRHRHPDRAAELAVRLALARLFPMFIIFFISALAETNRPPFDLPEAESELVAGFMVEYGSTPYMMFMLGEYAPSC
jgi:NADH-quinone oxidoreductase subunit H